MTQGDGMNFWKFLGVGITAAGVAVAGLSVWSMIFLDRFDNIEQDIRAIPVAVQHIADQQAIEDDRQWDRIRAGALATSETHGTIEALLAILRNE